MNLENRFLGKTLLLDNNQSYQVVWITNYNEKNYMYLINCNDYSDIIFCHLVSNNGLNRLTDTNIILEVMEQINSEMNIFVR